MGTTKVEYNGFNYLINHLYSDCHYGRKNVDLIRYALNDLDLHENPNVKKIKQYLDSIEECCKLNFAQRMQSYHAFEMMRHFALAIGDKYDPMYTEYNK